MDRVSLLKAADWLAIFKDMFKYPPNLIVLERCSSTMDIARQVLKKDISDLQSKLILLSESPFTACFSLAQDNGRGRRLRKWESNDSGGIYLSVACSNSINISSLNGFSLVIGLAIVRCLKSFDINAQLKWPNDVFVDKKKIAGVLIETIPLANGAGSQLIIGIGLNVNQELFDQNLNATSMLLVENKPFKYEYVAAKLLRYTLEIFEEYISKIPENCFLPFKSEWWKNSNMPGKFVENLELKISGTAVGLSDQGALIIENSGVLSEISVGDVGIVA